MGIGRRGSYVGMAQKGLYGPNVAAIGQHVTGAGMAEKVCI